MPTAARLRAFALAAGLALSAALVVRAQVSGDQLNLLARGWLLATRGELVAYGNPLSTGGNAPGALTSVLVGAPLVLWRDHRAPVVLIWLLHLGAYLLLDRALRAALTPLERAAFAVLYWLNPWRLSAAAFLWNPNYLVAVGAAHLASARALARRPGFLATLAHVLALGLGAQLHPAVLLLGVHSLLLWARGYLRICWPGLAAGVGLTGLTLVPWLVAIGERPELVAAHEGFLFRSLVLVAPWLKGLSYWLRMTSLALPSELVRLDFGPLWGAGVDSWLTPAVRGLLAAAGAVGVGFALWANVGFLRGRRNLWRARWDAAAGERAWLEGYVALALAAAVAVFALAPTTPMSWQAIPLLHAAVLPAVWGFGALVRRSGEARTLRALAAVAAVTLAANLAVGLAAPNFRCGGRQPWTFPLAASSPMFEELGLERTCPWPLGVPRGWWPDVLPREP